MGWMKDKPAHRLREMQKAAVMTANESKLGRFDVEALEPVEQLEFTGYTSLREAIQIAQYYADAWRCKVSLHHRYTVYGLPGYPPDFDYGEIGDPEDEKLFTPKRDLVLSLEPRDPPGNELQAYEVERHDCDGIVDLYEILGPETEADARIIAQFYANRDQRKVNFVRVPAVRDGSELEPFRTDQKEYLAVLTPKRRLTDEEKRLYNADNYTLEKTFFRNYIARERRTLRRLRRSVSF